MKARNFLPLAALLAVAATALAQSAPLPEQQGVSPQALTQPAAQPQGQYQFDRAAPPPARPESMRGMQRRLPRQQQEQLAQQAQEPQGQPQAQQGQPRQQRQPQQIAQQGQSAAAQPRQQQEPMRLRAELDRPVQPAGRSGRAVLKISLEPERIAEMRERPPVNLAIAMDNSGSMSGHKMEHARRAALEALGKLGPRDRFALVTYNDRPETVIPSQHPRRHNRPQMQEQIRNIRANNSTALYAGVNEAAAEVRRGAAEGTVNRIILLSDGQANVGPSSPEDLRALGNALAGEDIVVSSVGLGNGFNEDLMTGIAQAGQGNSYFVENSGDLTRIFESELSDTMNVSATDVTLVVELAPGVRPVGIIGREGRVSGNKAEFQMRQLFGGQRKFALIELEVPAGQDGQQQEIAEINVNYIHAPSGKPRHSRARAQASYSQDEQAVRKAANPHVARAVVDNRLAETQRRAVHLSDSGQHRQAAEEMRRLNQDVTLMNMMFEDAEIANQAAAITREAVQLERNRLSNTERKNYFYRSYQTINQQQSAQ